MYTGWDKEILSLLFTLFMHGISLCLQNHNLPFRKIIHRFIFKIHTGFNAQRVVACCDCSYYLVGPLITKISRKKGIHVIIGMGDYLRYECLLHEIS